MVHVPPIEETACNLCGTRDFEVVATEDRDGRPLRTTICRRCGLVWTNPRPSPEAIDEYYRSHYRQHYKKSRLPGRRKILRGVLGALERRRSLGALLAPGLRVLDVGSGAGELVLVLRAAGVEATGLEPDEAYAEFAREVLRVPVQTGAVSTASVPPESLDLVTMYHALEHVADPVAVVAAIASWLKVSGRLVIEVPNVESVAQAPAHRFHFAHLFTFSPGTLSAVAARGGLEPVDVSLTRDGGNIVGVFRKPASGPPPQPDMSRQYEQTRAVLAAHTPLRHYLSLAPYARIVGRARQRLRENRMLARYKTVDEIVRGANEAALSDCSPAG
jgi:SAM-dependent methyltransferase